MIKRRTDGDGGGGLELLLDTMCNAFGGVMFIAMLVAILSQFAQVGPDPGPVQDPVQVRELLNERNRLRNQVSTNKTALAGLDQVAGAVTGHPGIKELQKALAYNRHKKAEVNRVEGEIGKSRAAARRTQEQNRALERKTKDLQHEIQVATAPASNPPTPTNTRTIRLPEPRNRGNYTFWMIVRWNRLFLCFDPAKFPQSVSTYGPTGVKMTTIAGGMAYKFKPSRSKGIDLAGDWKSAHGIKAILNDLSPSRHDLIFAVYPDSYAAFIRVRDFFILDEHGNRRYHYYWLAMNREPELSLGTGQGPGGY